MYTIGIAVGLLIGLVLSFFMNWWYYRPLTRKQIQKLHDKLMVDWEEYQKKREVGALKNVE